MDYLLEGVKNAAGLIVSFDPEIFTIVGLSLFVSMLATFISLAAGIPLGMGLGTHSFPGKGVLLRVIYTLMSMPPVIAGLFLFLIFMRRGPLGSLQLNYTVTAMIVAQICLVMPIIVGLTYNLVRDSAPTILRLGVTLGGSRVSNFFLLVHDLRRGLAAAAVSGFGRAISEVGAVMIVGGNITDKTRVMTTYIAALKSMGDYSRAIAVGIILLLISFLVNTFIYHVQQRGEDAETGSPNPKRRRARSGKSRERAT
ncbi:MAG: ABC transporter permease [Clostridiales Family XIII bacterium]|nr:ABC transporter permease [Clostridiales Family XIII bacterium]